MTQLLQKCATETCSRPAAWIPTRVARFVGNAGQRRCKICCNAIAEAQLEIEKALEASMIRVPVGEMITKALAESSEPLTVAEIAKKAGIGTGAVAARLQYMVTQNQVVRIMNQGGRFTYHLI